MNPTANGSTEPILSPETGVRIPVAVLILTIVMVVEPHMRRGGSFPILAAARRGVIRERARIKKESFKSEAEYRRFLRDARYNRRDIYERVELQLLSMRIQRRIEKQIKSKSEEQKVFNEFVAAFNKRWRPDYPCPGPRDASLLKWTDSLALTATA